MGRDQIHKLKALIRNEVLTELALERTILAKQRTILAETSIFLGLIGLCLLILKFYSFIFLQLASGLMILFAVYRITRLIHTYKKFKRKIKKIDRKNRFSY